ncbi:MAG: flippase-like domain-containing protein [Oligoflexia bacterium]|nr:flippase-like domain-containing protein [Oligoflexia bacterium]
MFAPTADAPEQAGFAVKRKVRLDTETASVHQHRVHSLKRKLLSRGVPWIITVVALYLAFEGVDWATLIAHIREVTPLLIAGALALTVCSYLFRSRRWQHLFPRPSISFSASCKVLILGFFMNNILPARAGEFVRAHMGAKVTGETRTLVLATIATERLADGVMLSLFFVAFALGLGDQSMSSGLLYVAYLFAAATASVALILVNRARVFSLADRIHQRVDNRASRYATDRLRIFMEGLSPLYSRHKFPILTLWTFVIWSVELGVYYLIQQGFNANLSLHGCVLFMVAVNFSSLIPAAPGGIGVIEWAATAVLTSIGVPREQALSMVILQHAMQYLVVGIPGAMAMLTWKKEIPEVEREIEEGSDE